jgi:hypothetical protein
MQKRILLVLLAVAWVSLGSRICLGQEVVHAVTGTLSATDPNAHTITVKTDDGSEGLFKDRGKTQTSISFDKGIEAQATPVDQFAKIGSHVIVYYFGDGDVRTAVAVKDLGTASVHKSAGTVTKFDHHQHLLTLKDDAGQMEEIAIGEQTSVDTPDGVAEGFKYKANRGDHLTVIWAAAANGQNAALFICATE